VTVRVYQRDGDAVVEVEDTGIGMEPEVAEGLFQPFRQASGGTNRKYEGTGIGLAVTEQAVEEIGGRVEVETEKGDGSRFTVWLLLGNGGESSSSEGSGGEGGGPGPTGSGPVPVGFEAC